MVKLKRIISWVGCFVITIQLISAPLVAYADLIDGTIYGFQTMWDWILGNSDEPYGGWTPAGWADAVFSANKEQKYYTTPTESVEDRYGNVTNYYRGGDTTTTKIIDSYNKTFNTIHNTTNTTNNYEANVKLSDFLNTYATYNNSYTYQNDFKSWYYDYDTNNFNYNDFSSVSTTNNNLYYNEDNRQYYISIDNSTDEYYLIDVQYSPTFVTVNYNYYNTTNNYGDVGDVTNIYYFELTDGRNSADLTASEVAGLDLGYDVANYVLVPDDPNTLSLQHFDGDYTDSSSYGRSFYSENRSTNYVDSGAFGQAVKLPSGSAAGITIPGLSDYDSLSFDFRIYYADIADLEIYLGDTNLFQEVPALRKWIGADSLSADGQKRTDYLVSGTSVVAGQYYSAEYLNNNRANADKYVIPIGTDVVSSFNKPTAFSSPGYEEETIKYGWMTYSNSAPVLYSSDSYFGAVIDTVDPDYFGKVKITFTVKKRTEYEYRWSPSQYVTADFNYDTYKAQWVPMRIVVSGGQLYYFVNGDLVGSGSFTMPDADEFYIKSSGTLYLDELRVTTGDMVSTGSYNPSSEPYDTNMVLALPDDLTANTIYVKHSTPVTSYRIGGVRPSNPTTGFFYIPLHDDYTGGQPQLYDGSNWVDVEAMVYDGSKTSSALGYVFNPVGASPDVDEDLEPGRPTQPGEDVDPETCIHDWVEDEDTPSVDPTCVMAGSVTMICTKCGSTKTETIPKLSHAWEVKTTVQTSYDEEGNIVTEGYTIYKCTLCGEEYKDTEGTGSPSSGSPDDGEDGEGGNWFTSLLKKLGEFLGTTIGGLLELVGTVIEKVLDSLITLVTNTIAKLTEVVNLFGSFGDAVSVLWTWLPPEIVTVLVAGVTVVIFAAVIKLFLR